MPENKNRPKIRPSHNMTEWQKDTILRYLGHPYFFNARRCINCGAFQAERHDIKDIDPRLLKSCEKDNSNH